MASSCESNIIQRIYTELETNILPLRTCNINNSRTNYKAFTETTTQGIEAIFAFVFLRFNYKKKKLRNMANFNHEQGNLHTQIGNANRILKPKIRQKANKRVNETFKKKYFMKTSMKIDKTGTKGTISWAVSLVNINGLLKN